MRKYILAISLGIALYSCQSDNEEDKNGNKQPNGEISYLEKIQPIIQTNCMVCHNAQSGQGGLVIEGEATMLSLAQSGVLEEVLLLPANNPRKMPPGFNLSSADLNILLAWIEQVNE